MAKKKKKVEQAIVDNHDLTEGQYYWCVNCGHHGDYGFVRKNSIKCEMCDYDPVTLYSLEEINDPFLDSVWIERFKTKKQAQIELVIEKNKFVIQKSSMAKNLLPEKTLAEKLADIRKLNG